MNAVKGKIFGSVWIHNQPFIETNKQSSAAAGNQSRSTSCIDTIPTNKAVCGYISSV